MANEDGKKGFSGLSDLVSEVSDTDDPGTPKQKMEVKASPAERTPPPQKENPSGETASSGKTSVGLGDHITPKPKMTVKASSDKQPPPRETGGGSGSKWIWAIIAGVFVLWIINSGGQGNNKPSSTPSPSPQSYNYPKSNPVSTVETAQSTTKRSNSQVIMETQQLLTALGYDPGPVDGQYGSRTSKAIKAFQQANGYGQDGKVNASLLNSLKTVVAKSKSTSKTKVNIEAETTKIAKSDLKIVKPSVGTNNVLSVSQIRWCVREGIRINAMRDVINTNNAIDKFNRIVNDSNSRCGNYRYRQGSQRRAERDVEVYRSQIVLDAIRTAKQLNRSSASTNVPANRSSKRPNSQYTRDAQQLLTDLGYKPGPVDGQYGQRTVDAVKAFQKDVRIARDGWIDQNLLKKLKETQRQTSIGKNFGKNFGVASTYFTECGGPEERNRRKDVIKGSALDTGQY